MDFFIKDAFAQHTNQTVDIGGQYGFGFLDSLGKFTTILMPLAFSVAGVMVFFYFIIAAIELINSQGDKAHIVSARSKIYHALIGLILLLLLYLAFGFILETFSLQGLNII